MRLNTANSLILLMKLLTTKINVLIALFLFSSSYWAFSQANMRVLDDIVKQYATDQNQSIEDYSDYEVTSFHTSSTSGITHYYLRQQYEGIPIHNAVMSIHLKNDNQVLTINNEFINNISSKINTTTPALQISNVFETITATLKYNNSQIPTLVSREGGIAQKAVYSKGSISRENIPVQLMYQLTDNGSLNLSWDLSVSEIETDDWWSMRVDAASGEILDKINWTVYCFGEHEGNCAEAHASDNKKERKKKHNSNQSSQKQAVANSYTVYPIPVESPIHGTQQTVTNPADPIASPFGWHDTNGAVGNEFTITRGNNVWAREDADNNDTGGFSPDGGATADFNFNLNFGQALTSGNNQSAVITNLFYMNNVIHDVMYHYGFDEASGNFQANTYGNGGSGGDWVNADAQDGSGTNNANMSVPADGQRARMQMFIWDNTLGNVAVNSPPVVAGNYPYTSAAFGATSYNVTGNVVIASDGSAAPTEACGALVNAGALNGNIALIDRGNCEFGAKCLTAENAGAIAVIVCNNVAPGTVTMAAGAVGASVTIPAVMLSQADCATIRTQIPGLNVTIVSAFNHDSALDNGIIAHEYGHGISLRLTGGRNNANCLNNTEQMGEGWSDFYGLIMTIEPGDSRTDSRPIGSYVTSQPVNGTGIRSFPYSTDFNINPHTYLDIANEFAPHGVGSVWCAMLWEMTWDLIDAVGFDPDIYYGTGGNNIALNLVTEAMKLQPCSPGFVDGRDAILAADQAIYNGEYNCLIRKAFARRGLGDNASQGNVDSQNDGSEDFNAACTLTSCASVDLDILFDGFPGQTSWDITDASGMVVASGGSYGSQNGNSSLNLSPACLPDGCYDLNFYDAVSNGMCPFQSNAVGVSTFITPGTLIAPGSIVGTLSLVATPGLCGNYQLTDGSGNVLVSGGGNFGTNQSTQFCLQNGQAPKLDEDDAATISKNIGNHHVEIKPNVVGDELNLSYDIDGTLQINVLDVNGKTVQQISRNDGDFQFVKLNVANLTPGFNFIQIISNHEVITKRFVKK